MTAAIIMISTVPAVMSPSRVTYGMPATAIPQMAMTTVPPAKRTACPAVAVATPIASMTSRPVARFWL